VGLPRDFSRLAVSDSLAWFLLWHVPEAKPANLETSVRNLEPNRRRGFTLIELMVVVAIIGVLSLIAITRFNNVRARAKQTEARATLNALYQVEKSYYAASDTFTADLGKAGFQLQRGNRYAYYLELPASSMQPRNTAPTGPLSGMDAVSADTYAFSTITTQPTEFATDGTVAFSNPSASALSSATAFVNTGTKGGFVARAYGQIGSNNPGTYDAWFVSNSGGTVTSPCLVSNNVHVPAGVPGNTYDQTACK
jgi:prepilin-type N-terminal cleavage/methylation domain-containing protein